MPTKTTRNKKAKPSQVPVDLGYLMEMLHDLGKLIESDIRIVNQILTTVRKQLPPPVKPDVEGIKKKVLKGQKSLTKS